MKIISFIIEEETVRHILLHLGKWQEETSPAGNNRAPPLSAKEPREAMAEWDEAFQPAPPDELYFMDPVYPD